MRRLCGPVLSIAFDQTQKDLASFLCGITEDESIKFLHVFDLGLNSDCRIGQFYNLYLDSFYEDPLRSTDNFVHWIASYLDLVSGAHIKMNPASSIV